MKTSEYIIITLASYSESQLNSIDSVSETFLTHARYNTDKSKCIMKVVSNRQGSYPDIIKSLTRYNLTELASVLLADEWNTIQADNSHIDDDWTEPAGD